MLNAIINKIVYFEMRSMLIESQTKTEMQNTLRKTFKQQTFRTLQTYILFTFQNYSTFVEQKDEKTVF